MCVIRKRRAEITRRLNVTELRAFFIGRKARCSTVQVGRNPFKQIYSRGATRRDKCEINLQRSRTAFDINNPSVWRLAR